MWPIKVISIPVMDSNANSVHFVVHSFPASEEKLNDWSDKISKQGLKSPSVLRNVIVNQVVIGLSHVTFLLQDGRTYRLAYSLNCDQLDLVRTDSKQRSILRWKCTAAILKTTKTHYISATVRPIATKVDGDFVLVPAHLISLVVVRRFSSTTLLNDTLIVYVMKNTHSTFSIFLFNVRAFTPGD